jgi:hypothetical protein
MRRASRREGPDGTTLIERGSEQQLDANATQALRHGQVVSRDASGALQTQPRVALDERPGDAFTVLSQEVNVGRLLRSGYTVQQDAASGTTTFWPTASPQADTVDGELARHASARPDGREDATLTPAQQGARQLLQQATTRLQLIKQGALTGSLRTARQAVVERLRLMAVQSFSEPFYKDITRLMLDLACKAPGGHHARHWRCWSGSLPELIRLDV